MVLFPFNLKDTTSTISKNCLKRGLGRPGDWRNGCRSCMLMTCVLTGICRRSGELCLLTMCYCAHVVIFFIESSDLNTDMIKLFSECCDDIVGGTICPHVSQSGAPLPILACDGLNHFWKPLLYSVMILSPVPAFWNVSCILSHSLV